VGWLGAHVVADAGHDVAEVAHVVAHISNYDVAGVITKAGQGVSGWSAGDPVVAFLPVTAPAEALAAAPRAVELADAAALPSADLTAWQSLFEHASLKA